MTNIKYKKTFFLLCGIGLFLCMASASYAQSTWTGDIDSDWHNMLNWSGGTLPTSTSEVHVDPVGTNPYPVITQDVTVSKLFISNSGTGGEVTVSNGSTLTITDELKVGNNGALYVIENSTVNVSGSMIHQAGSLIDITTGTFTSNAAFDLYGTFNVGDGTANFNANVTLKGSGVLNVDTGTINSTGVFIVAETSTVNLGSGTFNPSGNFEITDSGTFNAQEGTINFSGKSFDNLNSGFNPGTSTFSFTGNGNQNVKGNTTFYNLEIQSGSSPKTVSSENDITVLNDLYVGTDASLSMSNSSSFEVQGNIDNNGTISTVQPYITSVIVPDPTQVVVYFSEDITQVSAENTANYAIDNSISVTGAVRDASDLTKVVLTVSELTLNLEYKLTLNNITGVNGGTIKDNTKKRFIADFAKIFYSRQDGPWDDSNTWSTTGHTGLAAPRIPINSNLDSVIVGNGNTVDIQTSVRIDSLSSLEVNGTGQLQVGATGTLTLESYIITGTGSFVVNSGGTLEIGSPDGIAASGATGNIQTGTRTFSTSANYTYSGSVAQVTGTGLPTTMNDLRIDNPSGVQATGDLIVDGALTLSSGDLIMGSGTNLIAPTRTLSGGIIRFQLELPSSGWYALSSPAASTYADLLDSVITQGYPGAYYSTGSLPGDTLQPNVLYYDESYAGTDNQRWRTLGGASNSIVESRGHFVYVFGDVSGDSRYNKATPNMLEVAGDEFEGDGTNVNFNITYTATADTGWNLVGNPFAATIDWDDEASWTKTNVDNTVYVWDHSANGGNGEYLVWNGFTGSLGNGLLAPFQGFWVKANAANPVLTVERSTKTTGGVYHKVPPKQRRQQKAETPPVIEFMLEADELSASYHISFSGGGSRWKDSRDAYRLTPFTGSFIQIFSTLEDGTQLSINNLPRKFGREFEIPIHAGGLKNGKALEGTYTISWPGMEQIPPEWQMLLEDRYTKQVINLKRESFYSFDVKLTEKQANSNASPDGQYMVASMSNDADARFVLRINPHGDAEGLPDRVVMDQNYPNPFGQNTTIELGLPLESRVNLTIYDILGRKIAVLADDIFEAGFHSVSWNPKALASGVYLYVLQADGQILSRKMTYIK